MNIVGKLQSDIRSSFSAGPLQMENKAGFWSSQKGTNGLGDLSVDVDSIKSIVAVRLTKPWNVAGFDPATPVEPAVPGSDPAWIQP